MVHNIFGFCVEGSIFYRDGKVAVVENPNRLEEYDVITTDNGHLYLERSQLEQLTNLPTRKLDKWLKDRGTLTFKETSVTDIRNALAQARIAVDARADADSNPTSDKNL